MNKYLLLAMVAIIAVSITSCKSNEKNYKTAYDIVKNKEKAADDDIDPATLAKIESEKKAATAIVAGDSVRLVSQNTNIVDGKYSDIRPFSVIVGEYKQIFNARSFRDRLISMKQPSYVLFNGDRTYFVVAAGFDTSVEAAEYLKSIDKKVKINIPLKRPWILARP